MSAASPITETTLFLHSIITSAQCKIDFVAVGAALNLQSGTAAMRYRRLIERINKSNTPQSSASAKGAVDENSLFLYQCMVASNCKPDWHVVGVATGLKSATASMRWRRLHLKIQKEHGSNVGLQDGPVAPQTAQPTARGQKATSSRKRKTNKSVKENESDDEVDHKKLKAEEEAVPETRQTRGKKLDFKGMMDSSSSEADSGVKVEDDDESMSEGRPVKRESAAPRETKRMPSVEEAKASKANDPITPPKSTASHSSQENPKPTPSSIATSIQRQRPVPPPLTPLSGVIAQSIESDDHVEADAKLDKMRNGRFVQTKRSSQVSSKSARSSEFYEADSESASTSIASSLEAQAPTESNFLDADDTESVAPDDSISMVGKATQGGIKRMRKVHNKSMAFS